jgi:hypothetical protein
VTFNPSQLEDIQAREGKNVFIASCCRKILDLGDRINAIKSKGRSVLEVAVIYESGTIISI